MGGGNLISGDFAVVVGTGHTNVLAGDACDLLPDILAPIPAEQTICVWRSFALQQGPASVRERIERTLTDFSRERAIYRISLELQPADLTHPDPRLEIYAYQSGELARSEWLAPCALHGEYMQWRAQPGK